LALAIVNKAKEKGLHPGRCTQFEMEIGLGARGIVEGKEIHLGSEKYLERLKIPISKQSQLNEGENTLIYVAVNKKLVGVLAVADRFKAEAKEVIQNLQKKGLEIVMMTGDHEKTAQFMANQLGISTVYAGLFPQEKLGKIKEIQKMGKRVAMVGDGINDAPGLAAADIGIALGAGTDVAIEASDVTLVGGDLRLVEKSLTLSRKTIRIIRQNLFFAFIYNTLGIPIAAGILYPAFHVLLNPMVAALAMSLSSVSVVTNSLRLRNIRL
jgi:P-type E1-E2 ATPase